MISAFLVLVIISMVQSWPSFKDKIPNGNSVPCKCKDGMIWKPVGHYNDATHTQLKNPFGLDFRTSGFAWTKELCEKDSDKDGKTNGEELGDPTCVWKVGSKPTKAASGHPGICEPIGSTQCQYQNFSCQCLTDLNSCKSLVGGN